ncbi:hypothetical protein RDWZM_003335 [Blomia tropicalis]|uniref:Strictosidine synthase conserved region domain-containing protein n=1 Tax=Blomia tropicalis TaxID=40697 RepID=A0A9Q0MF54_BLOTA|nr:hypothetical protein RDWZM_003335 [Blomia tropicalis]
MAMQIKDIFSRLYKITFDLFFYTAIIATILALLPENLFPTFPLNPNPYSNEHLFKGLYGHQWNNDLVINATFIGTSQLYGPESMVSVGEYIYTGLADGRLVRIHKTTEEIELVLQFSTLPECGAGITSKIRQCGRFLGLRHHTDGHLYAIEASTGLYRIDLSQNTKEHIPMEKQSTEPIIYNDLVFDPQQEGLVYITVSSNRWYLDQIAYSISEHEYTGYVLAFDLNTRKSSIISEGHSLTNGIDITGDKQSLIFSATNEYAIKKISLEKARESFTSGTPLSNEHVTTFGRLLPGEPDNIRIDETNGDILVGMFTTRPYSKLFRDYLCNWPFVRKALSRTAYSLSLVLDYIDTNLYQNHALQQVSFDLYSGHIIYKLLPKRDGAVIKLDGQTGMIKSIHGSEQFNSISEAIVDQNGDLYFGSFRNVFLGRVVKGKH